jgi:hypothetical protein
MYLVEESWSDMEREISDNIRLRVRELVDNSGLGIDEVARRMDVTPFALETLLARPWTVWMALRIAERLDLEELKEFRRALAA